MPDIFNNINWIDLIFLILLLGIVYKGLCTGVGGQILSLAGWLILVFVSIGYYDYVAEAFFGSLLQTWAKPLSFFAIMVAILTAIKMLERLFVVSHSAEMAPVERLGGGLVAVARAAMFFGLLGILMLLVPVETLHEQVKNGSRSCMYFIKMDARIYSFLNELTGGPEDNNKWETVLNNIMSDVPKENIIKGENVDEAKETL